MLDRDTVAGQLEEAFAGATRRPAPPLVAARVSDAGFRARVERTFAGAAEPLQPAFLREHAHESLLLELDPWRWFWRAMLLTALRAPWEAYDPLTVEQPPDLALLHASVYTLRSNPCVVLHGGGPDDVMRFRARLSPGERTAIGRYLQLLLEHPGFARDNLAQLASQAILWGWRDDAAALEAAERHRHAARAYRRPPADDPDDEALAVQIEAAFADTPRPAYKLMTSSWEEASEYALELEGAAWQSLEPWFLGINHAAFSFMTPAAFRYFIPAALCHDLVGSSEVDPEFHLVTCMIEPSSYQEQSLARARAFAPAERAAIAAFLRARLRHAGEPAPIEAALRTVWAPTT